MKKNSNKRSSKKALVPALLATLCSLGALTSVSYAWFTMGDNASVGNIDVKVEAADGMQISADAKSWKSILPVDELKAVETNLIPRENETVELSPVSTVGSVVDGKQQMFKGVIQSDGTKITATDVSNDAKADNYLAFDIYVKLDKDSAFYLDEKSYVKDLVDDTHEDKDTSLASRVSFAYLGNLPSGTPAQAIALAESGTAKIWEPNANEHTKYVEDYDLAANHEFKGVNSVISENDLTNNYDTHFSTVDTLSPAYDAQTSLTSEAQQLFNLKSGVNKIRVYIWVEGQDIDCNNDVAEGLISVGLNFKKTDTVLEGLELPETETVEMGSTITLAALNKNGIALPKGTDVEWELVSSDNNCLTIDSETGKITPVAAGSAVVKAKVAYQDGQETKYYEDTCTVTVTEAADEENA